LSKSIVESHGLVGRIIEKEKSLPDKYQLSFVSFLWILSSLLPIHTPFIAKGKCSNGRIGEKEFKSIVIGVEHQTNIKKTHRIVKSKNLSLPVSKPMSDSEELFFSAVAALWEGQQDAENAIIRLLESQSSAGEHTAPDTTYTGAFLDALRWGLSKYGVTYEGYAFYRAICMLEIRFRNRY
jgi:hypothetical protein